MRLGRCLLTAALVIIFTMIAGRVVAEQQRRMSDWERIQNLWKRQQDVMERESATRLRELMGSEENRARAEEIDATILKLQPWFSQFETAMDEARRTYYRRELVIAIERGTRRHAIDHRIAIAMAMQETSLLPFYGYGGKSGSRGERGYFQVFPHGAAEKVCSNGCNQFDPVCNADTALCYLSRMRDRCGDDPWLYVSAYNRGSCLRSRLEAAGSAYARRVRLRLCAAYSECNTIWIP